MDLLTKDVSEMSDFELSSLVGLITAERLKRERRANLQLIENFKKAANALAAANITYHVEYQDDNIYLSGEEDYHFDYY